jgi:uncharacterized membrane protein YedE/YeeE
MSNFTPVASALGGVLIGLSVTAMLLLNGRIAGCSGIVGGTLAPKKGDFAWRACFVAGLVAGGVLLALVRPSTFTVSPRPLPVVVVAGLLVGLGTALSNGCTSGHGVCGLSRLSKRSFVATVIFMATATAAALLYRKIA